MPLLSINQLFETTGIARATIVKRLANVDPLEQRGAKLYESRDVLPLLYGAGASSNLSASDQKARLLLHQANTAELKELELRGNLIPREDVAEFVGGTIRRTRSRLLPLGSITANNCKDLSEVQAFVDREIRRALDELSNASSLTT